MQTVNPNESDLSESLRMILKNSVSFGLIRLVWIHSDLKFGLILIHSDYKCGLIFNGLRIRDPQERTEAQFLRFWLVAIKPEPEVLKARHFQIKLNNSIQFFRKVWKKYDKSIENVYNKYK